MDISIETIKPHDIDMETPYDVVGSTALLLGQFSRALPTQTKWMNVWHIAELTSAMMGTRLLVGDASHYIFDFARRQGYDVPAVPYAGNGELKKFLKDEGVKDIPGWYNKIGFTEGTYQTLYEKTIVAASNGKGQRKLFLLDGQLYNDYGAFKTMEESGFIRKAKPQQVEYVLTQLYNWLIETA